MRDEFTSYEHSNKTLQKLSVIFSTRSTMSGVSETQLKTWLLEIKKKALKILQRNLKNGEKMQSLGSDLA